MKKNNGNNQLNEERENFNTRVTKYKNMGGTAGRMWRSKRRFRSI